MNNLNYQNVIFFDLLTTGLSFNSDIAEIAAIDAISGDTFVQKIFFYDDEADFEILEKFGYNQKLWRKEGVEPEVALRRFSDFCLNHSTQVAISKQGKEYPIAVLAGFNVCDFDKPILVKAHKRYNIFFPFDYRCYDIMHLAFWRYAGRATYSLDALCELEGIKKENSALSNAIACFKLAQKILAKPLRFEKLNWSKQS